MARQNGPQFNRRSTAAKLRRIGRELGEALERVPDSEATVYRHLMEATYRLSIAVAYLDDEVERRRAIRAQLEEPTCPKSA